MLGRVRPHLTYANVMVTILAFIVLGGVAVAATTLPRGSVGTNQLKGNAVTQRKIHRNAVTQGKIRNGSVTGAKVKDGSLRGADIVSSTLGTVPYAERAGTATNATTAQAATTAQTAQTAQTAASAASAGTAESANTATSAQTAGTATNAHELGGEPPSAYAPSSRFFYVTVNPSLVGAELVSRPGVIQITTDANSATEHDLAVTNESSHHWLLIYPGPGEVGEEEQEDELAPGQSLSFKPFPELTALIMLQDREEPQKAVALQCGLALLPEVRITCFATLSPALSP